MAGILTAVTPEGSIAVDDEIVFSITPGDQGVDLAFMTASIILLTDDGLDVVREEVIGWHAEPALPSVESQPSEQVPYTISAEVDGDEVVYTIARTGGWPCTRFTIYMRIHDVTGETNDGTLEYDVDPPFAAEDPGGNPEVSNVSPAPGVALEASTQVSFDVTDDSGLLRRTLVAIYYSVSGVTELAHDGTSFLGPYAIDESSRDPIDSGFRYVLMRDGGWPSSPTLRVFAFDRGGNENE